MHQDFVLAYGLVQEGDSWLRPGEGYEVVARRTADTGGETKFLEIRTEYLRDYLAARNGALRLYYYRRRQAILAGHPVLEWQCDEPLISEDHNKLEVRCDEIDSSGDFAGATWAHFKAWRTDVDPLADVPDFSEEPAGATASESRTGIRSGEGVRFRITGEMWRGEWIEPHAASSRLGDLEPTELLNVGDRRRWTSGRFSYVGP